MPRMVRGFCERWKRAAKTIFVMIAMLGSLLLPSSSTPLLVALLDIGIPCVILSTILKPALRSDQVAYDFRSSLLDILIVSIARSFAIVSAYFLRGARCDAYLMIAALLGLISAALVAVKACVFAMVVASSPPPSPELGSNFGVAMIFASSFACAVGHGVSAYRTSCQAKKKSFPQGDEESRFFYKYITVKLKLFRSSNLHKDDEDVESDEKMPLCALVADDNSKFMLCNGLHLHYKLFSGDPIHSRHLARSESLPLDHDHLPGGQTTLLRSSSSSLASCSLARDDSRENSFVEFSESSSNGNGIVLVHGFGGGVFSWRHIIAPLARQTGYSVASFDRPGWGLTSRTSDKDKEKGGVPNPNPYQFISQVDLLLSFCQQLNFTSVVLVGHDDGGLLALMAAAKALKNPASFQVVVQGVVLIGVSLSRQTIPTFARVLLHTSLGRKILRPLLCSEMASRRAWHDASKLTSEVMELYKVPLRVEEWDHHQSRKPEQVTPDLLRLVQNLPALLVAGTHDMLVPLQAVQALSSKLSKSKLVAIPRCGHLPPEERPAALLAALVPFVAEIFKSLPSTISTASI